MCSNCDRAWRTGAADRQVLAMRALRATLRLRSFCSGEQARCTTSWGERAVAVALLIGGVLAASIAPASARGTVRIQQSDGSVKVYHNVLVSIRNESMAITSSDGKGTLVLGKAACSKIGELVRCFPYDATLIQFGESTHVPLQTGTVWLNPSQATQPLPHSSTQLLPRGVLMAVRSKRGTYVSLTGTVDKVTK